MSKLFRLDNVYLKVFFLPTLCVLGGVGGSTGEGGGGRSEIGYRFLPFCSVIGCCLCTVVWNWVWFIEETIIQLNAAY